MDYLKKLIACFVLSSSMLFASDTITNNDNNIALENEASLQEMLDLSEKKIQEELENNNFESRDRCRLVYDATKARLKHQDILSSLEETMSIITYNPKNLFKMSFIYKFVNEEDKYNEFFEKAKLEFSEIYGDDEYYDELADIHESVIFFSTKILGLESPPKIFWLNDDLNSLAFIVREFSTSYEKELIRNECAELLDRNIQRIDKLKIGLIYSVIGDQNESYALIDNVRNHQGYKEKIFVSRINKFAKDLGLRTKEQWVPLIQRIKEKRRESYALDIQEFSGKFFITTEKKWKPFMKTIQEEKGAYNNTSILKPQKDSRGFQDKKSDTRPKKRITPKYLGPQYMENDHNYANISSSANKPKKRIQPEYLGSQYKENNLNYANISSSANKPKKRIQPEYLGSQYIKNDSNYANIFFSGAEPREKIKLEDLDPQLSNKKTKTDN